MGPIVVLVGSPGAGKSTLARAILRRFEFGIHIPVDDLREWVVSGIAHPLDWTSETTRQFELAERAACEVALRYSEAGFAVVIDHCRLPRDLGPVLDAQLEGRSVTRVVVTAPLETLLLRNDTRTNKPFEGHLLIETIRALHPLFEEQASHEGWLRFDNSADDADAAAGRLLRACGL